MKNIFEEGKHKEISRQWPPVATGNAHVPGARRKRCPGRWVDFAKSGRAGKVSQLRDTAGDLHDMFNAGPEILRSRQRHRSGPAADAGNPPKVHYRSAFQFQCCRNQSRSHVVTGNRIQMLTGFEMLLAELSRFSCGLRARNGDSH